MQMLQNLYEEALHGTKVERDEYDFYIDAVRAQLARRDHVLYPEKCGMRNTHARTATVRIDGRGKQCAPGRPQGTTFKTANKNALTDKAFIAPIGVIMGMRVASLCPSVLMCPFYPRACLQHCLTLSHFSRFSGT